YVSAFASGGAVARKRGARVAAPGAGESPEARRRNRGGGEAGVPRPPGGIPTPHASPQSNTRTPAGEAGGQAGPSSVFRSPPCPSVVGTQLRKRDHGCGQTGSAEGSQAPQSHR